MPSQTSESETDETQPAVPPSVTKGPPAGQVPVALPEASQGSSASPGKVLEDPYETLKALENGKGSEELTPPQKGLL